MRRCRNPLPILILLATWPAPSQAAPPAVGDMGTVDRLDISGTHYTTPARLRDVLGKDLEFLLAAEPAAALDPLLATISRRLEAGYRRLGFAQASVTARPDLQLRRIRVAINEGPRYMAGDVRIVGQAHVSPADLARRLAAGHPLPHEEARVLWQPAEGLIVFDDVAEKPIWLPGKPARFNRWSREQLRRQVYLALAEFGYFFPKLKIDIVPAAESGQAELVVEIEEEGPPGVVGSIEVLGAERHSPDAILRYLELAPGQPLNRGRLASMQMRLFESGRFVFAAALPTPPRQKGEPVGLRLKLIESVEGPLLGQPFSAEEQAMLRLRGWLVDQARSGQEDLVLSLRDASLGMRTLQAVISARGVFLRADVNDPSRALSKGVLFKLRSLAGAAPAKKEEPLYCLAGLEMTGEQIALYSPLRDRLFAIAAGETQLGLRLKLRPDLRQQRKLAISIDPEINHLSAGAKPVAVDLDLAPAAFLILAHTPEAPCRVEQGVLRLKTKNLLLEADAASGRLLKAAIHDTKQEQAALLSAAPRRLERSIAEMRRLADGDRNDRDARRPLTSLSAFGICELAHLWRAWEGVALAGDKRGFDVWQGLLAAYFLPDLDSGPPPAADSYFIPAEPLAADRLPRSDNGLTLAAEALYLCREVFPAESWPCRLARAAVFFYANDDRGAQRELLRIDLATAGPLGHLAAALVAGMIEPTLVNRFASAGLNKLDIAAFRRDYSLLLESRSPVVGSVFRGLGRLGKLDPAHSQAAVSVLPKPLASFVGDLVARERTLPDAPAEVIFAGLLDDYWTSGLELQARFVLRWLAESSATARGKTKVKAR